MKAAERMLSAKTYRPCVVGALAAPLLLLPCAVWAADPEEKAPPAAWPTSPFLGAVDGVTGVPIPWLCRSGGSVYRLGDTVCMSTHLGVQTARCDLVLNNTSWGRSASRAPWAPGVDPASPVHTRISAAL